MFTSDKELNKIDDIFEFTHHEAFQDIHFKWDPKTNLKAIVAIHSTNLGPALGGCRFISYPNTDSAIIDALRLARGMSYKAAITGLNYGGGKAVLIKPDVISDRKAYFEAFGRFVQELGGRYITAKDSGTSLEDMDIIATQTPYVASTSDMVDPSPFTAFGVRRGIQAAVKFQLKRDDLEGLHIAIQGVGGVGYYLAKDLHEFGAKLTVCDVDNGHLQRVVQEFGATAVKPEDIYHMPCDVFSPCALGAILNDQTLSQLRTTIIAGAANNQLAQDRHGKTLKEMNILYAPDYVINAGGLIHATAKYDKRTDDSANQRIHALYDVLLDVFHRAQKMDEPTNLVADHIAQERLHEPFTY